LIPISFASRRSKIFFFLLRNTSLFPSRGFRGVWVRVPVCGGGCDDSFYPEKGCSALKKMIAPGISCKNNEATSLQNMS